MALPPEGSRCPGRLVVQQEKRISHGGQREAATTMGGERQRRWKPAALGEEKGKRRPAGNWADSLGRHAEPGVAMSCEEPSRSYKDLGASVGSLEHLRGRHPVTVCTKFFSFPS